MDDADETRNSAMDVAEWEQDSTHAFIIATFDPATQRRTAISVNSSAAALLGMHREELLARYMQHDVPLALPPLDALRHLLNALRLSAFDTSSQRYYRMLVDGGRSAALVCTQTVRIFDARRRICQVRTARPAPAAAALLASSVTPPFRA